MNPRDEITLKELTAEDLPLVLSIQTEAYSDPFYHEPADTFRSILSEPEARCWLAEHNGEPVGYLFAHPNRLERPPKLGGQHRVPPDADCYFIHDLAKGRKGKGLPVGRRLFEQAKACAAGAGFRRIALIAVQGSQVFWTSVDT